MLKVEASRSQSPTSLMTNLSFGAPSTKRTSIPAYNGVFKRKPLAIARMNGPSIAISLAVPNTFNTPQIDFELIFVHRANTAAKKPLF